METALISVIVTVYYVAQYLEKSIASIQEQTNNCSYEGVEDILEALRKAKERLNANVNFDLTMELLCLTIKENITE